MIEIINSRIASLDALYKRLARRNQMEMTDVYRLAGEIVENVKHEGDKALIEYTERFDGVSLNASDFRVTEKEIDEAFKRIDNELLGVIRRAKANIESFHQKQKENSWFSTGCEGAILGQLYRPLEIAGVYVPGGTAAYPSSVLMNVVPAKVAGVEKIVMVTPPKKDGINPAVLVAAKVAGVDEVYRVGGAQPLPAHHRPCKLHQLPLP